MHDSPWIQVPGLYDDEQLGKAGACFNGAGIDWKRKAVATGLTTYMGANYAYTLYVSVEHLRKAARALREFLELEDPTQDRPFTGSCPACQAQAVETWSCPSCELSFRSLFDAEDPIIAFVREHRGFDR